MKKIQSVYGIYKKHGREAFLSAAEHYSDNVDWNSVEKTVSNMESTWYSDQQMPLFSLISEGSLTSISLCLFV